MPFIIIIRINFDQLSLHLWSAAHSLLCSAQSLEDDQQCSVVIYLWLKFPLCLTCQVLHFSATAGQHQNKRGKVNELSKITFSSCIVGGIPRELGELTSVTTKCAATSQASGRSKQEK